MIHRFPDRDALPAEPCVGGKALSLLRLGKAGLPVPPGVVIDSGFFAPWQAALSNPRDANALASAADRQQRVAALPLDALQRAVLERLDAELAEAGGTRFAVRSSAIGEDSGEASFAGQYETLLGVPRAALESAIRECFAASLAPRVQAYRQQHGIDGSAAFAVIVQRQIDSAVAGVGFSLDPLSNDYDHAVFAASWGLGSSVVDGRVDADQYVVDKTTLGILQRRIGAKLHSIRLDAEGGVAEIAEAAERAARPSLDERQLGELTQLLGAVERLFGGPVDIEWAIADDQLYLLQARPITTFVPLPEVLLTAPGPRRRLYLDAALSKGMTSNRAFSTLGLQQIERAFLGLVAGWFGPIAPRGERAGGLIMFAGGRMYLDLGDLLRFASPARLAAGHAATDTLTASILAAIDAERYRAQRRPAWFGAHLLWRLPRALWRLRRFVGLLLLGLLRPQALHRRYLQTTDTLVARLQQWPDDGRPLDALQDALGAELAAAFEPLMAALLLGQLPLRRVRGRRDAGDDACLDALGRGSEGNIVVAMSLALGRLATLLDRAQFADIDRLAERLQRRDLPAPFLVEWDAFVRTFGCRGADEMDIASPRYADDPRLALRQIAAMAAADGFDLARAHAAHAEQRSAALAQLLARRGPLRRWLLRRVARLNALFGGSRDTPKYVNVLGNHVLRRAALRLGARLCAAGRLDRAAQVFDLGFDDLNAAAADPALDLRARAAQRTAFLQRLQAQVRQFPPVIDSRGRILRAPPPTDEVGVLRGMPVSAGVARGPVRVLHRPEQADVAVGDILVAYTTDPGWTPLFVNAAAIVLEVGGVLQHGAVIAREFGKPCVVGIAGVVTTLRDGEQVEVDGAAGTITRLDAAGAQ